MYTTTILQQGTRVHMSPCKETCARTSRSRHAHKVSHADSEMCTTDSMVQQNAWLQKTITLPQHKRGCHVITRKIYDALPEIGQYEIGLANLFIQHTSASLTINENASPDVPLDLNDSLDRIVPEGNQYRHLDEGYDDMPAHVKSSLMGASLTLPISRGRFALGTWQGIYLNEHRNYDWAVLRGSCTLTVTN
eukprot:jgi/Chrzof1/14601/Cz09g09020.t1